MTFPPCKICGKAANTYLTHCETHQTQDTCNPPIYTCYDHEGYGFYTDEGMITIQELT